MRRSFIKAGFYVLTMCFVVICGLANAGDGGPEWLSSEVAYGHLMAQTAILCSPVDRGQARPGALLIHGGGWTGGGKSSLRDRCQMFARNGIVSIAIDYRLATAEDNSTRWPAQLQDARAALRWMHEGGANLGLDVRRICAYGESAGGHIAIWLGIENRDLACVVDAFGPVDLSALGREFDKAFSVLFGNSSNRSTHLRDGSPLWSVKSDMAPVLIIQGEKDKLVPADQWVALLNALRSKEVPVSATLY